MRSGPSHLQLALSTRPEQGGAMGGPLKSDEHPLFARAFREHSADLIAFVRRRVATDAEAADIAQEAYLRVLRYRGERALTDLRALLFRIAANLIGERLRIARVQQWAGHVPLDDELAIAADNPSLDREVAGEQQLDRLVTIIGKLPRKCQQVFLLNRFGGLSRKDIAQRMGITLKAVDKHILTALAYCRKTMGRDLP